MNHQLGTQFKNMREKANLTQAGAAKALGYSSPQFISNVERGLCLLPADKIRKTAKLYKVNPLAITELVVTAFEARLNKFVAAPVKKAAAKKKKALKRPARKTAVKRK